jgi:hypothetical protein
MQLQTQVQEAALSGASAVLLFRTLHDSHVKQQSYSLNTGIHRRFLFTHYFIILLITFALPRPSSGAHNLGTVVRSLHIFISYKFYN